MRKSKFTESQIVAILAEGDAGLPVAEVRSGSANLNRLDKCNTGFFAEA